MRHMEAVNVTDPEELGSPDTSFSVHLTRPVAIRSQDLSVPHEATPIEVVILGNVGEDLALYFSGTDKVKLANLDRLTAAVEVARLRILARYAVPKADA